MKPIDLSLLIEPKIPSFPGSPLPQMISWENIKDDGYNLELLFMSSHTGTHIDAPNHFFEDGLTVEKIPLKRLIQNAILIKLFKKRNQSITLSDIKAFEEQYEQIPQNSTIVFFTNWQKNSKKSYFFTENPGLDEKAAKYLVSKKINLVGIDSPSIDLGKNSKFPVHKIFSKKNILIVENLDNLEKIPSQKFLLSIFPLKLKGASGSPIRAVAY
jgi:arylformamidase